MKYHIQEHLYNASEKNPRGSCYPTVLACLLDLELHDVPYFHLLYFNNSEPKENLLRYFRNRYLDGRTPDQVTDPKEEYKKENYSQAVSLHFGLWDIARDYWLASIGYKEEIILDIDQWLKDHPDTPYMASGKSSRGIDHVVIYMNGKLLHDPHPSGEGLIDLWREYPFTYLNKH